ncbi:MAG: hypothetical protein HY295_03050 [Thaumarchaeota archaeon]|nr:hypothetical protein [Nitrososphaerota archaeon]
MVSRFLGGLMILMILSTATTFALVQYAYALKNDKDLPVFYSKGKVVENSHFPGTVMWTLIKGDKGKVILQTFAGREVVSFSVSLSDACENHPTICISTVVTEAVNTQAIQVGDTANFGIDINNKQQKISLLSGFLANVDVTVNLTKINTNVS